MCAKGVLGVQSLLELACASEHCLAAGGEAVPLAVTSGSNLAAPNYLTKVWPGIFVNVKPSWLKHSSLKAICIRCKTVHWRCRALLTSTDESAMQERVAGALAEATDNMDACQQRISDMEQQQRCARLACADCPFLPPFHSHQLWQGPAC